MFEYLISVKIERLEQGSYLATSDCPPELLAQGRTIAETMEIAQDVARKLIESYLEHGDPIPESLKDSSADRTPVETKIPISMAV